MEVSWMGLTEIELEAPHRKTIERQKEEQNASVLALRRLLAQGNAKAELLLYTTAA